MPLTSSCFLLWPTRLLHTGRRFIPLMPGGVDVCLISASLSVPAHTLKTGGEPGHGTTIIHPSQC